VFKQTQQRKPDSVSNRWANASQQLHYNFYTINVIVIIIIRQSEVSNYWQRKGNPATATDGIPQASGASMAIEDEAAASSWATVLLMPLGTSHIRPV